MSYPVTNLSLQKGKYYVVCTIPQELREALGGRKQLKRSSGTSDLNQARQKQHQIATEMYAVLDEAASSGSPVHQAMRAYLLSVGLSEPQADVLLAATDLSSPTALEDLMFNHRGSPVAAPVFSKAKRTYEKVKDETPDGQEAPSSAMRFDRLAGDFIENHPWGREKTKTDAKKALTECKRPA